MDVRFGCFCRFFQTQKKSKTLGLDLACSKKTKRLNVVTLSLCLFRENLYDKIIQVSLFF